VCTRGDGSNGLAERRSRVPNNGDFGGLNRKHREGQIEGGGRTEHWAQGTGGKWTPASKCWTVRNRARGKKKSWGDLGPT